MASSNVPSTPVRPALRRRGRILLMLLAVLTFIGLAPLATGVWRLIGINREALATSTQQFQLLLASSIAEKLDFKIDSVITDLEQASQALTATTARAGAARREQVRNTLGFYLNDRIRYLRYVDPSSPDGATAVGPIPDSVADILRSFVSDTAERAFAGDAGRVVMSRPVLLRESPGHSVLLIAVPAARLEENPPLLYAIVDLRSMWSSVTAQGPGGNVVYALDETGRVFASTDPSQVPPGEDMNYSTLATRFLSGQGRARETMPYTDFHGGREKRYLGSYESTLQGWGVFVRSELDHVYSPLRALIKSTVTWMLVMFGISAGFAGVFATSLSRPITQLVVASREFARGKLSTRVHVRSRTELGELGDTFNGMAAEIQQRIEELRTAAQENSELFEGTILALAKAIDAKDHYTRGHSIRVNEYSVIIAKNLELDAKQIRDVHVAALLHDVGKIGVDDGILKKAGRLTTDEYEIIKTHAAIGANIMSAIPPMKNILPGLRWHHERMDGSGYPDALSGEQIPLMSRIIAVADTFDAMTSERSYQRTRTFDEGLQLLHDLEGELDAGVVAAFDRAYRDGKIVPPTAEPGHERGIPSGCAVSV